MSTDDLKPLSDFTHAAVKDIVILALTGGMIITAWVVAEWWTLRTAIEGAGL